MGLTADPSGDVWVANCYPARRAHATRRANRRADAQFKQVDSPGGTGSSAVLPTAAARSGSRRSSAVISRTTTSSRRSIREQARGT